MIHVVRLRAEHDVAGFDCGVAELNEWLVQHARTAQGQGTPVWLAFVGDALVGYYALAPYSIERASIGRRGRGAPQKIPGYILAKLAVVHDRQGERIGGALLANALTRVVEASRQSGGKLVVVDAISDAAEAFYAKQGFERVSENPGRLVQKLATVAAALELDWP